MGPLPPGGAEAYLSAMLLPTSRPEATFDLHGQGVREAELSTEQFLRAQRGAGRRIVRVVTGRGKGGGGAPVRTRVRTLLRRLQGEVVAGFELEDTEGSFLVELNARS
jgi:DNA-nicking Smr family endonuclease